MPITRQDIAAHLERQVRTGFLKGMQDYTPLRSRFVRETPSDSAFETYTDMGDVPWPVQNAGTQGSGGTDGRTGAQIVNRMNEGGRVTVVGGEERGLIVYNLDWEIVTSATHNAINDDNAGDLEQWARDAGRNFEKHKDFLAFDALNQGDSDGDYGVAYNGLSFFNDSHVDPGAEYQTTQDNNYSLGLSIDNFETVKVAGSKLLDSRGQPVGLNHNLLVVPPDLERTAAQIARNPNAHDTANQEINPYEGTVQMLVAPGGWLDTTAWFLLDISQGAKPINLQMRQDPELITWDDESQGSGIRYWKLFARYSVFFGDWRLGLLGNS